MKSQHRGTSLANALLDALDAVNPGLHTLVVTDAAEGNLEVQAASAGQLTAQPTSKAKTNRGTTVARGNALDVEAALVTNAAVDVSQLAVESTQACGVSLGASTSLSQEVAADLVLSRQPLVELSLDARASVLLAPIHVGNGQRISNSDAGFESSAVRLAAGNGNTRASSCCCGPSGLT